jgi:hypothetical protein
MGDDRIEGTARHVAGQEEEGVGPVTANSEKAAGTAFTGKQRAPLTTRWSHLISGFERPSRCNHIRVPS